MGSLRSPENRGNISTRTGTGSLCGPYSIRTTMHPSKALLYACIGVKPYYMHASEQSVAIV